VGCGSAELCGLMWLSSVVWVGGGVGCGEAKIGEVAWLCCDVRCGQVVGCCGGVFGCRVPTSYLNPIDSGQPELLVCFG